MRGLEVDGGDLLGSFEHVVPAFEVGLVAVGGEHLGGRHRRVVGDDGEAAVAGGVSGHDVFVDVPGDAVVGAGEAAVAGVGPGPASLLLPEGLVGGLGDGEADPAGGADAVEGGGGGGFDCHDALDAGLG